MKQPRFLRRSEVIRLTGLSTPSIYRLMSQGAFPRAVKIGARAVAWRESDVAQWMDSCPNNDIIMRVQA